MAQPQARNIGLYGCGALRTATGEALRPGGPELTGDLIDLAGWRAGDRVVDIGCGQGESLGGLVHRGIRASGVDLDPAALELARERVPAADLHLASGMALPFEDQGLEGVLAECCLSLMPDRMAAIREWARVLKPGGCLALSDVYARKPKEGGFLAGEMSLTEAIRAAGLRLALFSDRTEILRVYAARFIFEFGSMDALWGGACGLDPATARELGAGYAVIIAEKPGLSHPARTAHKLEVLK